MAKRRWARDYTQDVVDAKRRFDDAREHIKEPPDGQIPLNDWGIYTSPNLQTDKPVDPRDCDQYPDSPYCGGNPWTKTPVGLEPEWGVDECGAWIEVTPVLGFTKLPPVSVGYRRPGKCREEEKPIQQPKPIEDLPDEWKDLRPDTLPAGFNPNDIVLAATTTTKYRLEARFVGGQRLTNVSYYQGFLNSIISPTTEEAASPPGGIYFPPTTALTSGKVRWTYFASRQLFNAVKRANEPDINEEYFRDFAIHPNHPKQGQNGGWFEGNVGALGGKGDYIGIGTSYPGEGLMFAVYYGKFGAIFPNKNLPFSVGISDDGVFAGLFKVNLAYLKKISGSPDHYPPPPDQKKKRRCCMQCCSGGNQAANKQAKDNAEILRLLREIRKNQGNFPYNVQIFDADDNKVGIQKRNVAVKTIAEGGKLAISELQRTLKAIGIDHFPIYSPSSIIQDESNGLLGDLGDLKNKIFKQKIESLAEFLVWRAKNDNEIFGTWQEVIEIQDSDPNQKGNQPKRVVLPNMAKTLKEIILLLSVLIKSQGFSMDALLKLYIDVANTKVSASVSEAILRDIQDYLDYPTITKPLDVPMGITIPKDNDPTDDKEDIERFLQNSKIKAMFDDWTGEGSLHDMMLTLLDAASRTIQKPHT